MKKKTLSILILCVLGLAFCLTACGGGEEKTEEGPRFEEKTEFVTPYSLKTSEAGKTYFTDTDGGALPLHAVHVRFDQMIQSGELTAAETGPYFQLAAETGFNLVETPVTWSRIETAKDVYDYSDVENYLRFAKNLGLKLNLIWYGSFVDGQSQTADYPAYIWENPTDYTVLKDLYDFGIKGRVRVLKWNDPDLLRRESLALYNMMNAVYAWCKTNDYYPVVCVQLGQGVPDRFVKWRVGQYYVRDAEGALMTESNAMDMIGEYLNALGRAVKYSSYRAFTRAEFCMQNAVTNLVAEVKELQYVDMVSPTYLETVPGSKAGIYSFATDSRLKDMPVVNSENWADDVNHRQIFATFASGGIGYSSYYLSSPLYYPMPPNASLYGRSDASGTDLAEKFAKVGTRADDTKAAIAMLDKAAYMVATAPQSGFATLGMDNRLQNGGVQKTFLSGGIAFEYIAADAAALGYVISDGRYIYVCASVDTSIKFTRCALTNASEGALDRQGEWTKAADAALIDNNSSLALTAGKLYRVRVGSVEETANKWFADNGYFTPRDCLRG
jgi:hypothetical protein